MQCRTAKDDGTRGEKLRGNMSRSHFICIERGGKKKKHGKWGFSSHHVGPEVFEDQEKSGPENPFLAGGGGREMEGGKGGPPLLFKLRAHKCGKIGEDSHYRKEAEGTSITFLIHCASESMGERRYSKASVVQEKMYRQNRKKSEESKKKGGGTGSSSMGWKGKKKWGERGVKTYTSSKDGRVCLCHKSRNAKIKTGRKRGIAVGGYREERRR